MSGNQMLRLLPVAFKSSWNVCSSERNQTQVAPAGEVVFCTDQTAASPDEIAMQLVP